MGSYHHAIFIKISLNSNEKGYTGFVRGLASVGPFTSPKQRSELDHGRTAPVPEASLDFHLFDFLSSNLGRAFWTLDNVVSCRVYNAVYWLQYLMGVYVSRDKSESRGANLVGGPPIVIEPIAYSTTFLMSKYNLVPIGNA